MTERHSKANRERTAAVAAVAAPLATLALALVVGSPALAQGGVAADARALATSQVAPTNLPSLVPATDIFAGKNVPGPYELTWNKLLANTQQPPVVQVDGKRLPASAYTLDLAKGVLTFKEPLKTTSMARIDYAYAPGHSTRNANPAAAPVTLPVVRTGATSLQLTALPNVARAADKAASLDTLLVWGLNNKMNLAGGGLTSQLYLSPEAKSDNKAQGGDGLVDRAGVSLGYKTGNAKKGFDASFLRTGRDFAPQVGKAFGMGDAARQQMSLAARYEFTNWFNADWNQVETRALTGAGGSTEQERWGVRLGGIGRAPSLGYTRVEDVKTTSAGVSTEVVTDQMNLSAKLNPRTAVTGSAKQVITDAEGENGDVKIQEASLALNTESKNKAQAAALTVNTSSKESFTVAEERQQFALTVKASPTITITAEQKQESVTPLVAPKESDDPSQRVRDEENARDSSFRAARAEFAVAPGTKLITAVQTAEVGDAKTSMTEMSAQIGAIKGVDLRGSFINRSASHDDGPSTLNTTQTSLALKPMPTLTLTGGVTINPVDNRGVITEAKRQELGMQAKIGSLELGSAYSVTSLTAHDAQTGEFALSLGLRVNRFTQLQGAYKDALLWGADEDTPLSRGLRVYSLGLTHTFSTLNFTFGGSVTQNKQDTTAPDDIKAEAKFGVTF